MTYFAAFSSTYHAVDLALYEDTRLIATAVIHKHEASKMLLLTLQDLLAQHSLAFADLSFLAVNQGPAPFTTLRVVIATVNGLAFATGVPLVGCDGLTTLLDEYTNNAYPVTVALLNAFAQDVYFGIQEGKHITTGYDNYLRTLDDLAARKTQSTIRFIGNAVPLYRDAIIERFGKRAYIPEPLPEYVGIQQIAAQGLQQWNRKENVVTQLMPLYLKQAR